jgi:hypothetical protein
MTEIIRLVPMLRRGNAYDLNADMDPHGGPWEPE